MRYADKLNASIVDLIKKAEGDKWVTQNQQPTAQRATLNGS